MKRVGTIIALLGCLAAPASASAERWASPTSADTTGTCLSTAPCRVDHAINNASPGERIVLASGPDYTVTTSLVVPAGATVEGEPNRPYAVLQGGAGLAGPTLDVPAGGTVKAVGIGASAPGQSALRFTGGGLIDHVSAVAGPNAAAAVDLAATPVLTIARDSVFFSRSTDATSAALEVAGVGTVAVRNVTSWGLGAADGVHCAPAAGAVSFVNVLSRGVGSDIDATGTAGLCTASYSNFRPGQAPDLVRGAGHMSAEPQLANATIGQMRPLPHSPLIDAGTDDALLGATDLDTRDRKTGGVPDIGAYEGVSQPKDRPLDAPVPPGHVEDAPADPRAETDDEVPEPPRPPALGRSFVLGATTGAIFVKAPGAKAYIALDDPTNIPVGSVIDARKGSVTLSTALPGGKSQTGTFSGGQFEVRQPKNGKGMTDIVLRGGDFAGCSPKKRVVARAASRGKRRKSASKSSKTKSKSRTLRRLWGSDRNGKFRTHGRESVATVRGTKWLTEDRCDGTLTKVTAGAVDVKDRRRGKVKRVRAGQRLLVKR